MAAVGRVDAADTLGTVSGTVLVAAAGLLARLCRAPEIIPAITAGAHTNTTAAIVTFLRRLQGVFDLGTVGMDFTPAAPSVAAFD